MKSTVIQTLAIASLAVLTACSGGAGGGSSPVPAQNNAPQSLNGNVALTITIPAKNSSSQSRSAKYLTSNIQGVAISAIPAVPSSGPTPTPGPSASPVPPGATGGNFYKIGASQSYCSTTSAGLTCTLDLQAPAGSDLFTVTTYDAPYYGNTKQVNVISTGTLTATISAGVANTINVVTNGVPQWGIIGITNPVPSASGTTNVSVNMVDADGNVIVGSYDEPVQIVAVDSTMAIVPSISFSKQSFLQNSDATGLTMTWNGTAIPNGGSATVYLESTSPVLGGLTSSVIGSPTQPQISEGNQFTPTAANAIAAPAALYFAHANSAAQTVNVAAANSANAATLTIGTCTGIVTISGSGTGPYTITPVAKSATFYVQGFNSNCDLSTALGGGGTENVPVMVSP